MQAADHESNKHCLLIRVCFLFFLCFLTACFASGFFACVLLSSFLVCSLLKPLIPQRAGQ